MNLTAKEACYLVGVSRATLYRWVKEGMPKSGNGFESSVVYEWYFKKNELRDK